MSNPESVEKAKKLIAYVDRTHRYSVSRIYGLWNVIFDKSEKPQPCAVCLVQKIKEIRRWLSEQIIVEPVKTKQIQGDDILLEDKAGKNTELYNLSVTIDEIKMKKTPKKGRPCKKTE